MVDTSQVFEAVLRVDSTETNYPGLLAKHKKGFTWQFTELDNETPLKLSLSDLLVFAKQDQKTIYC